jgi:hypothetical protein
MLRDLLAEAFGSIADFVVDHRGTIAAAPIIAGTAAAFWLAHEWSAQLRYEREVDAATLCPVNAPSPEAVLLLLDQTDALALGNAPKFQRIVVGVGEVLPRHGRMIIVPFGSDLGAPLRSVWDLCNPGRGRDADPLNSSARLLELRYQEQFAQPLAGLVEDLSSATTAPHSPIAAQVERAARDRALGWTGVRRRLIILSDFLENNAEGVSVYTDADIELPTPREAFLDGVEVQLVVLANSEAGRRQTPALMRRWREWLSAAGATLVDDELPLGDWAIGTADD